MELTLKQASKLLDEGKIVSFPTETVYALAANAMNEKALRRIYKIKGRDFKKPLAILVENVKEAKKYVNFNDSALILAEKFCPGPISFVLPKSDSCNLPDIINGGLDTLSVRIPNHQTALAILKQAKFPVVATSANPSGKPDATNAKQVQDYFDNYIDMIIEGGSCSGLASTVVDLCGLKPKILREGEISAYDILKIIDK